MDIEYYENLEEIAIVVDTAQVKHDRRHILHSLNLTPASWLHNHGRFISLNKQLN